MAFVCNGQPFAVMMATPADLEDFALGFALSEGIVEAVAEIAIERIEPLLEGVEIRLTIPQARADALERRRRGLGGRSGCGICGSELLETALRQPAPPTPPAGRRRTAACACCARTSAATMRSTS